MPGEEDQIDTDELVLDDEAVVGFEDEQQEDEGDVVIAFADDEQEEDLPLVKKLRDEIRDRDRKLAQLRRAPVATNDDPEPQVTERPRSVAEFDYDEDRFNAAIDDHLAAKEAHSAWKARQSEREAASRAAQEEQAKRFEQKKNALGVRDFDTRRDTVTSVLSEAQTAVLLNAVDDPARMIAALGAPGAASRLSLLSGEENLARFAAMLGKMEKEIKVIKKTAPAPESQVRGATATLTQTEDKHLARLEREAEKTGDRSAIQAYRREQRRKAAA